MQALRFVNEEISNFGGDPNKITISGSSAGSCFADMLSYSPLAKGTFLNPTSFTSFPGLFSQVFMESGTAWLMMNGTFTYDSSPLRALLYCNVTKEEWESKDFGDLKLCMNNVNLTQEQQIMVDVKNSGSRISFFRLL